MGDSFNVEIRKKIGENLKRIIEEKTSKGSLRNIDAITNKDHSWLGKIFRGEQNFTARPTSYSYPGTAGWQAGKTGYYLRFFPFREQVANSHANS